jgi:HlyD family secretion protein
MSPGFPEMKGVFPVFRKGPNKISMNCHRFGLKLLWGLLALLLSLTAACTLLTSKTSENGTGGTTESVRVERGDFKRILRLTGRVNAVESFNVNVPRLARQMSSSMVITKILPSGANVKKGDALVEFDRQDQLKSILDSQAEYDNLVHQIDKKRADQTAALAADNTEIKGAEVDLQTAKVEIRKNDLIPKNEAEINLENLREAEAKLKLLQDTFALKRAAEAADLQILEIQRDRAYKAVSHEQNNVEEMTIRSPMDGLVVLVPMSKGTRRLDPEEGDEVRSGQNIMLVVNPYAMEVAAQLNQVDVSHVYVGQPAEIHLDAYPEFHFPGTVKYVSAIASPSSNSNRIRYFTVVVSIQGSDPKLLPDLTAAADIRMEAHEGVLLLPRNAVVFQEGRAWVQVLENGGSEAREIKTGAINECEIVIESGIDEGTTVALHPEIPQDRL